MRFKRLPPVALAALLQIMPVGRMIYNIGAVPDCGFAVFSRWLAGVVALMGSYHAVSGATISINSPTTAMGTNGQPFSYRITTTDTFSNMRYSASPVPGGLTELSNSISAFISGTPTNAGTTMVNLTVAAAGYPSIFGSITITIINVGAPTITTQPSNVTVFQGNNATFSVNAGGELPLNYQWRFNVTNLTDGGNISGSTSSTLTINNPTAANVGDYSVIVSNSIGSVTSTNAVLTFTQPYELFTSTDGGGAVAASPFLTQYPSNSIVTLTATPAGGWTFLNWLGDAQGTNPSINLTMNGSKKVTARFGTGLNTATFGNGSITIIPSMGLYPYGQAVHLVAQPLPGNYFVSWTNAAVGHSNPQNMTVQNNNLIIGAVFAPLNSGSFALTVVPSGYGQVNAAPPSKNMLTNGATVTLTAAANAGQTFIGWSDDAFGTNNPLIMTMDQSKVITANFTIRPLLTIQKTLDGQGVLLTLTGEPTNAYGFQSSSDLLAWTNLQTVTNIYGESQLTDQFVTNKWLFYQAVAQ